MRRLMSGCAAVSLAIGTLGVGWTLGMRGAQAASSTTGSASAVGTSMRADFNRDGFDDLAVGAPGENAARGVVHVIYGSARGLIARRNQIWHQNSRGVIGAAEADDRFGAAVATGDFDGDGFTDLAVGAPGENAGRGVVHVIYGSRSGLTARRSQIWHKDSVGIIGTARVMDEFGFSLAAANFGKSGQDDLAVGAPSNFTEDDPGSPGSVNVIYGSARGLTAAGDQSWTQDSTGIIGRAAIAESFGFRLAAANFGKSGHADLAVGVPNDNTTRLDADFIGSGAVNVLYGSAGGLTAAGDQYWTQDSPGILGTAQDGDDFGIVLTAANFGKSGHADLAVSAPGDLIFGRGAVNVIYGSATGLTAAGDQLWTQNSPGIIGTAEDLDFFGTASAAGDFDGDGFSDLAVGAPSENADRGTVNVIYGSTSGLTARRNQLWHQDSVNIIGRAAINEAFGSSLAAANFGRSAQADLAVGAPGNNAVRGSVNVIYGSARRLTAAGNQYWTGDSPGIIGTAEIGDRFGQSLASRQ